MGKNCYEKEKLSLIEISDNSNIVFFLKTVCVMKTYLLLFQKTTYQSFLA